MIESILAWILLFVGLVKGNPLYLIASAVYAVASRIGMLRKEDEGK
jgi:hypothetical protein